MVFIEETVAPLKGYIIDARRKLHRIPEIGMCEHETTAFILEKLRSMGMEADATVTGTGAIAFLNCNSSRTIAYRADIDALSVEEKTGLAFSSTRQGYMHACGHDGHASILLGFAKLMVENRHRLDKNILFIFQPAEEGPGGALPLVESGLFEKYGVECILGLHIFPEVAEGKLGCKPGPMMAQTGEFDIRILGKSSHGAMPHKGSDAINAAVGTVAALNSVVGRNVDPIEPAVLNIGRLVCGERRNIVAGEAVLEGTVRAFNSDTYKCIRDRIIKVTENIPHAFDCQAEYEIRDMYPAVDNDARLFELLREAAGEENLELLKPLALAEDFSYYQQRVPGLFFMLGCRNELQGHIYPLHSNRFDFNEDILINGVQLFYNIYKLL